MADSPTARSVSAVVGSGENETLAAAPVRLEVVRNLTCSEGLADNKNQSIRTRWNKGSVAWSLCSLYARSSTLHQIH